MTVLLRSKSPALIFTISGMFPKVFFFFFFIRFLHAYCNQCTVVNLSLLILLVNDIMALILHLIENQT